MTIVSNIYQGDKAKIGAKNSREVYRITIAGKHHLSRLQFESLLLLVGRDIQLTPHCFPSGYIYMLAREDLAQLLSCEECEQDLWVRYDPKEVSMADVYVGGRVSSPRRLTNIIVKDIEEIVMRREGSRR